MIHRQLGKQVQGPFALAGTGQPMDIAQGGLDAAVAHQALQAFHRQTACQLMGGVGVPLMPNSALSS